MASLFGRMRDIEDRPGFLTRLGYGAGAIFVAMLFGSGAAMGTVAAGVEFADMPVPDGEFARQFENLGFGLLLLFGMFAAGVFMAVVSFIGLHTALLPRWLAIAGLVAGPLVLLFGVVFIPMLLLVLWVLAVSIVLVRAHPTPA
jgi:prepilin signal peptidase PulO-like enzyme (type II secretory pathway)